MRAQLRRAGLRVRPPPAPVCTQCQYRALRLSASPSTDAVPAGDVFGPGREGPRDTADARFEVLGEPYSLLSVTLSASQNLYTRRGTLVALAGNPDATRSTLSLLSPLTRLPLGIPFLYQRITSAAPTTALIATRAPHSTVSVLRLDGTADWMVSQRAALLAWTGRTLQPSPRARAALPLAHWGATLLTGRGLAALAAPGQVYELRVEPGESFVAHPAHVVAYSVTRSPPPVPFRFATTTSAAAGFRLQVPDVVASWFAGLGLVREARKTRAYDLLAAAARAIRTSLRRVVWGDRLFLRFTGPVTLLMSSRAARLADVLTDSEVNEIAEAPAGTVQVAVDKAASSAGGSVPSQANAPERKSIEDTEPAIHVVTVRRDGKAIFEDAKDLKQFLG